MSFIVTGAAGFIGANIVKGDQFRKVSLTYYLSH